MSAYEYKMEKSREKYIEAVGRRKTAIARVRLFPLEKSTAKTSFLINDKELESYFPTKEMTLIATHPFAELSEKFKVTVHIKGGGIHSQSEALRHGIARALTLHNGELRKSLKKAGYLKRDPRAKERRKFGLKKARKSPQWSKR